MWQIENETRYSADRGWARDKSGSEWWLVAVRGTFAIGADGEVTRAEEQQPVVLAPEYFGEPAASSLRYDTDFVLRKLRTDVILHATAHAPGGRAARSVDVGVRIGSWRKRLRVHGPRAWRRRIRNARPTSAEPFAEYPITWESAWGGTRFDADDPSRMLEREDRNPIGIGLSGRSGDSAPRIEYLDRPVTRHRDRLEPAGFGPIPPNWLPRREYGGTCDDAWQAERAPLVPENFADDWYQCAPADQQLPPMRGGEEVELQNLTPDGVMRFKLPRLVFGFSTFFAKRIENHLATLHTVVIEPDARRLVLVWHSALSCHPDVQNLRKTVVYEKEWV